VFEDIRISYLVDKYSPASGAFSPRPEALDSVEAQPRTLCIGSKSRARNDCIDLPPRSKYFIYLFAHIKRKCSNRNNSRNKSISAKISHLKRLAIED